MSGREDLALCPRPVGTQRRPSLPRSAANCDFQADKGGWITHPAGLFVFLYLRSIKKAERK